jgi:peptide/nickel transport system ATP-binding protein
MSALLQVNDLKKHFPLRRGFWRGASRVYAVDGVSFHIDKGETLALVGESGCGKSTVGRAVLRLFEITAGQVVLDGRRIDDLPASTLRPLRRRMQVVFQDPFSSLNPRMRVRDILAEPIRNFGLASSPADLDARIDALLDTVRLPREAARRWPHEFSGGQRQRIGIARALAAEPDLIVCDEAVSALDVSVKAQIVNLLQDLQRRLGLAMLFISHDLAIVEHMTHRVAVMYLGKIVETASKRQIFASPKHPYTTALLSAVPVPVPGAARHRIILEGDVPSPSNPPSGCRFHTRCPYAFERCRIEEPQLRPIEPGQLAACHLHDLPPAQNPMAGDAGVLPTAPARGDERPTAAARGGMLPP